MRELQVLYQFNFIKLICRLETAEGTIMRELQVLYQFNSIELICRLEPAEGTAMRELQVLYQFNFIKLICRLEPAEGSIMRELHELVFILNIVNCNASLKLVFYKTIMANKHTILNANPASCLTLSCCSKAIFFSIKTYFKCF